MGISKNSSASNINENVIKKFLKQLKRIFTCPRIQENLVESKHHKLARSLRSGITDRDAKPNASVRDILNSIVSYPPTKQLSSEEQDLVWKFRFYLSTKKKALTKFLKCVNWSLNGEYIFYLLLLHFHILINKIFLEEERQALQMIQIWEPMDVEDALELLTPNFTHPAVRRFVLF